MTKPSETIRQILDQGPVGSLGTTTESGHPFVSMVTFAVIDSTYVTMLLSDLAKHTQHLTRNGHASLLVTDSIEADPMTAARVTLVGDVTKLSRDEDAMDRSAFLTRHPSASMYADFGDFSFYRFATHQAHLVAGLGRIQTLSADQLD